ncbi:MAG: class I SAM-dependent methyltransferase [Candidatus Brocadiia bacterium]
MAEDFWNRAQKGQRDFWLKARTRRTEGDPEKRRDFWNQYLHLIRRHRPFRPGDRVLDLGCGPAGIITPVDPTCERHGVDPLMDFFRREYALSPAIHYHQQQGESLAFEDGFFQVVTCVNVLDHTRDWQAVLREIHRVLEPGGYFLLELDTFRGFEYYRKGFKRWTRMVRRRIEKHPHTLRIRDVTGAVRRIGFQIVEQSDRPRKRRLLLRLLLRKEA